MLAAAAEQEVPGGEAGSSQDPPAPPVAAGDPQEGLACAGHGADEEEARESPQAGLESNTKAPSESLESLRQKSDSGIDIGNKLVNGAEKEISDKRPETAAAEGQAPQSGSEQAQGQEHQHTQGPAPAGDSPEPAAREAQGRRGSQGGPDDGVQQAGSSTGVSKEKELLGEAARLEEGAEEACGASLEASSLRGQESWHSTQRVSREASWQSLGAASCRSAQEGLGGDQASWQQRCPSPLSADSNERLEQVRNATYQAEEGATWISKRTSRQVTNKSQQTSAVWSRKSLAEILKSPTRKSKSIIDAEKQSLKQAEKETWDKCSETAAAEGQPTRQASQRGSQQEGAQGSRQHSEQEARRGSQQAPQQAPPGSQQPVPKGSQQPEEHREGSALVSESRLILELELQAGNLQGIELVVEENEQSHVFFIGLTETAQQKYNILSPSGENLLCSIASKIRSHGEQTSDNWMKKNLETAEKVLFQRSTSALEDAQVTYNHMSVEGEMGTSKMGKILVISDEQTGDTVIQAIHETTQPPGSQQSQHSHEAGREVLADVPEMCAGAGAEVLQVMTYQSWDSGQESRSAEMASGLVLAYDIPNDMQSVALPRETVSEAQQTHSVISLDEGSWIKRRTGKLLKNKSQQTSVAALQESSATAQE